MALRVKLRDEALADLEGIQRIHNSVYRTLAQIPSAGRVSAEGTARQYPLPGLPYLVLYLTADKLIDVVGVFHTSRNPADKPKP